MSSQFFVSSPGGASTPPASSFFDSAMDSDNDIEFSNSPSSSLASATFSSSSPVISSSSPSSPPSLSSVPSAASPRKRQARSSLSISSDLDPRVRYSLQKEIQQSIFGKLYLALDTTTNQQVALKVSVRRLMDSHRSLSGIEVLEDPREETALMQDVKGHPHVVSLVAVHEDADLHWVAQEYVGGGDLFDSLTRAGHYSLSDARYILAQILAGVAHLHAHQVAHLDLSLENLLVDVDGTIKICDFGLARRMIAGRKLSGGLNRPGKYGYMAPEVLAGRDFDGAKADVFSAGVILFSLLTGHPPFEHARMQDRRYRMIAEGQLMGMLRVLELDHLVSAAAADLITGMLHPNPERRLSVEQVLAHPWVVGETRSAQ